jgi:peptide/nickel transport system ATP-binding protein
LSELLSVSNLTVQYAVKAGGPLAVDKVSLGIPSTRYTLGVVGESGSGKTTLGLSIMNLIESPGKIIGGRVDFEGRNVLEMSDKQLRSFRWGEISMVYQSAMNSLNPVKTVSNHISEVIRVHKRSVSKKEAREQTLNLLSSVGIPRERADDFPHEFSGGMRQRVVIAMAIALSPKLLIADEPTSALDVVVQKKILALIKKQVTERNLSLLFITHEIALLKGLVENVAVMYSGEIVERGSINKVLFKPLHPYTEMLLESLLSLDSGRAAIEHGSREPASRGSTPKVGCRYANRCKYAFDRCRKQRPLLLEFENERWVACHKYN